MEVRKQLMDFKILGITKVFDTYHFTNKRIGNKKARYE